MKPAWKAPAFLTEAWYSDPKDPRCPHASWLESVEVREPAKEIRGEERGTVITLKLLGAHHDGWIVLSYSGVRNHSLCSYLCDQGVGDWLRDEFTESEARLTMHRITWRSATGRISQWRIEAEEINYEWLAKPA